eukprot:m.4979 g.4979  ORF g.4979 m.4979 type:complete len:474 (-) comp3151_c0_seq1:69-1490(-)
MGLTQRFKDDNQSAGPNSSSHPNKNNSTVKKVNFEFGGPIGTGALVFFLPFFVYVLFILCPGSSPDGRGSTGHCVSISDFSAQGGLASQYLSELKFTDFFTLESFVVALSWMALQVALQFLLPGERVQGVKLRDGTHLTYKFNAHLTFWITLVIMGHGKPLFAEDGRFAGFGSFDLGWCYRHYLDLATACMVLTILFSVYLYLKSFAPGAMLAEGGDTGHSVYDFFMGRELNPRFKFSSTFDLKEFCELKPGLIGWVVLNLGMACEQYRLQGSVSMSMLAINLFQGFYVWDALYHERAILTTMDITTDGFGYMLAFGDLCWVPFTYTLQARYLVEHDPNLSFGAVCCICVLNFLGYFIFRSANSEKDRFRSNPNSPDCEHLKYMSTARGSKLLISGWWGTARKINYTGDWIMGFSWCAVTGWGTTLTYFYAIYFAVLLIHRAFRDDHFCREKYGADWDKYKKHVPYMFVPFFL